jgi:hypothetical protein
MKKIKLFKASLIGFVLLLINCTNLQSEKQVATCQDFKYGVFKMTVDTLKIVVERKDEFQFERTAIGNSKYKVVWHSDCEYQLELIETNIDFSKKHIGRVFQIIIIETRQNQYSYECRVKGIEYLDTGTLTRL